MAKAKAKKCRSCKGRAAKGKSSDTATCTFKACVDPATGRVVLRVPRGSQCPAGTIAQFADAARMRGLDFTVESEQ